MAEEVLAMGYNKDHVFMGMQAVLYMACATAAFCALIPLGVVKVNIRFTVVISFCSFAGVFEEHFVAVVGNFLTEELHNWNLTVRLLAYIIKPVTKF